MSNFRRSVSNFWKIFRRSRMGLVGAFLMITILLVATFAPLALLGGIGSVTALWVSAVTALGAAAVEAVSPWGIDNLTVPAVSALVLVWLL